MPKISIIIPVYNQTKYIRECLDSCINQTFQDIEIICIDDKSTDDSLEIIKEYAQKDNRIKIIAFSKNKGPGAARNAGLKIAKGSYLMFLDPDDWYMPEACEIAYNQIIKNNNDFVIFNFRKYLQEEGEYVYSENFLAAFEDLIGKPDIKLWEVEKPFIWASITVTRIYKTDFVKLNNIKFDEDLRDGEDARFYFDSIIKSNSVSVIDNILYNYRKHAASVNSKLNYKTMAILARKRAYNRFLKSEHKVEYLRSFIPYYIRCGLSYYKHLKYSDMIIRRKYYNIIHKIFNDLNRKYDISQYKDEINYEWFLDIAQNSWNMKHNIMFEIPDRIKYYINSKNKPVFIIYNVFKLSKDKNDNWVYEFFNTIKISKNSKGKTLVKLFYLRDGKK